MQVVPIVTKGCTRRGITYPGQPTEVVAHIERNKSIRMVGRYNNRDVDITFKVGETAEYDSYNLIYLGEIVNITDKGVTIRPQYSQRTRRLDLNTFMWRNHDFDLDRISRANHETSMCI